MVVCDQLEAEGRALVEQVVEHVLTCFFRQLEASKPMDISIHLWWGTALSAGIATATALCSVLTMCLDVMSQEPPYMMWSCLRRSSVLESGSECP
jgi:hypothetical protein